jgi:hypothetical protein
MFARRVQSDKSHARTTISKIAKSGFVSGFVSQLKLPRLAG